MASVRGSRTAALSVLLLASACASDGGPRAGTVGDASHEDADATAADVDARDAPGPGLDSTVTEPDASEAGEDGTAGETTSAGFDGSSDVADGAPIDVAAPDAPSDSSIDGSGADAADSTEVDAIGSDSSIEVSLADSTVDSADVAVTPTCLEPCPAGQKSCGGTCVSRAAPDFGCGGGSCAACRSYPHAAATCTLADCALGACVPGWLDCNGDPSDGCESDARSPTSCGACSRACAVGTVCQGGVCVASCPFPLTNCGGSCRDLSSDAAACGACSASCDGSIAPTCAAGVCVATCLAPKSLCDGRCTDLSSDASNCGACGQVCPGLWPKMACAAGVCVPTCSPGQAFCSASSVCAWLDSDPANCGACGVPCGANAVCAAGKCVADTADVLLSGLAGPSDLAVDATDVYWTDFTDGSVRKMPKGAGAVTVLATGQAGPVRIALDDLYVYWSSSLGGAVLRAPKSGGSPQVIAPAVKPRDLFVDATDVYFLETGYGSAPVKRAGKGGGAPVAVSDAHVSRMLGSNTASFFVLEGAGVELQPQLAAYPKAGGPPIVSRHFPFGSPAVLATGGATAFLAYASSDAHYPSMLEAVDLLSPALGPMGRQVELARWPPSSAPPAPSDFSVLLAADDCTVFAADDVELVRFDVAARRFTPLTGTAHPARRLAVDEAFVYWIESTTIHRRPR